MASTANPTLSASDRTGRRPAADANELIQAQVAVARTACEQLTGPATNGMITSSRRRLLGHLRAGDADGAALEMENHLRVLHYMWRLARHLAASADSWASGD